MDQAVATFNCGHLRTKDNSYTKRKGNSTYQQCRECTLLQSRMWARRNPDKRKKQRDRHREKCQCHSKNNLKYALNMTPGQREEKKRRAREVWWKAKQYDILIARLEELGIEIPIGE